VPLTTKDEGAAAALPAPAPASVQRRQRAAGGGAGGSGGGRPRHACTPCSSSSSSAASVLVLQVRCVEAVLQRREEWGPAALSAEERGLLRRVARGLMGVAGGSSEGGGEGGEEEEVFETAMEVAEEEEDGGKGEEASSPRVRGEEKGQDHDEEEAEDWEEVGASKKAAGGGGRMRHASTLSASSSSASTTNTSSTSGGGGGGGGKRKASAGGSRECSGSEGESLSRFLPDPVWQHAFGFVPPRDLFAVMSASKSFLTLTRPYQTVYRHWNLRAAEVGPDSGRSGVWLCGWFVIGSLVGWWLVVGGRLWHCLPDLLTGWHGPPSHTHTHTHTHTHIPTQPQSHTGTARSGPVHRDAAAPERQDAGHPPRLDPRRTPVSGLPPPDPLPHGARPGSGQWSVSREERWGGVWGLWIVGLCRWRDG
jgi:hypothetical protein